MNTDTQSPSLPQRLAGQGRAFLCRWRRGLYGLIGILLVFGLLGFFWLPGFAKGKAEALLSEKLHRPVTVSKVAVNPYTLEATIEGLRIGERQGEGVLFGFDSLYVNLSTASLLRMAPVVSAVTLKGPQIHVQRNADGSLSIDDLIEKFSNQPESEPTRFSVSNVIIERGSLVFDDKLKATRQQIDDIHLGLPFLANFESAEEVWVQPHFSARINEGSKIVLEGKARPFANKREVVLDLKLDALDLTEVDEYAPVVKGLKLGGAKLDTALDIAFVQTEGQAPSIRLTGDIVLRELALANTAGLPWQLKGERLALHLQDVDPLLANPLHLALQGANLRLKQGDKPELLLNQLAFNEVKADLQARNASFALDATLNTVGSLQAKGTVAWGETAAAIEIAAKDVELVALQGFAGDRLNAVLTKGALSFKGGIKAGGSPLNVVVNGDAKLGNFNLIDKADANDLLRWRSLDIGGIAVATAPLKIDIESIALADFYARVAVSPEGRLNLKDLVKSDETPAKPVAAATPPATGAVASAPLPPPATALPMHIGRITLQGGNVNFSDRFIKPNYRANLTGLSGKIGPLDPGKPGQVEVRGAVDRSAPLQILGKVDPFGKSLYLDIAAKAKGIDLPSFSPYSGKYVGYAIEKGKLSVDLRYFVENNELRAENNIFLDQLTFGQKIDSPDALSVPVNLAVALLKNSRGEIDINLPISGSLNDPQFSVGSLVVKVIVNLIVKAVTSPFALLGSIFGGGADLSHIDFLPGYARLTPEAEKSLEALTKAMNDRPALKLEVTGIADTASDRDGLKRAILERRVKSQKLAALAKQGQAGGTLSEVEISSAEYPKYLEQAYKAEKFDKPKNLIGLSKSLPVAEMEQLMLANLPAGEEEMRGLAERRARAARDQLVSRGVAAERVFVLQPKVESAGDGKKSSGGVEFSLR